MNKILASVARFSSMPIIDIEKKAFSHLIGPGLFFVLPCIDTYSKVDLRTVTFDVPPLEILTKDSVTVAVDAVVYFRIFNAVISITNVEDAAKSTKLLAATTLRNVRFSLHSPFDFAIELSFQVLGTKTLQDILIERDKIDTVIQVDLIPVIDLSFFFFFY